MSEHDLTFDAMGSHVRLLIGEPGPEMAPAAEAAERARRFIVDFDAALSRFKPSSELCALNDDPRERVPASALLRQAVQAGLDAAERSGGLVDPTLVREIEGAGYVASRAGMSGASLERGAGRRTAADAGAPDPEQALAAASKSTTTPARSCARPACGFDTGGTGKGLAADLLAASLRGYSRFIVDCGGDIRIGGADALVHPYEVFVEHPMTRRARARAAARLRRRRHLRPQRPHLARRRRPLRPPPARPGERRAGLDRPGRRHRAGRHRGRGRDALQGGAALRARGRAASCSPSAAACSSTTTAASSWSDRSPSRRASGFPRPELGRSADDDRAASNTLQTHGWWLASRASGLVALVLVTISVGIGLTMAGKVMRRPGLSRKLLAVHEQTALAGLIAIAVHGITLLGDPWLHPGRRRRHRALRDELPHRLHRARHHRRLPGGAARPQLLRPQADRRRSSGARPTGRRSLVYVLGLVHALGAGTDASAVWFRWWVILTTPPIGGLFVYRVLSGRAKKQAKAARPPARPPGAERTGGRTILQNPSPRGGVMKDPGVVIVGGGLAAQRCAETLRRRGYEAPVRIVCAEPDPPYDRPPLSKEVLAGAADEESVAFRPG